MGLVDMTDQELRALAEEVAAVLASREAVAVARADVDRVVAVYAEVAGVSVLEAWRALAPTEVEVPDPPVIEAPVWVQPTSAVNAYRAGDRVSFRDGVYESLIDGNSWSPAAYPHGWKVVA